jgi:hypothetical protein
LSTTGRGAEWTIICDGGRPEVEAAANSMGARVMTEETPTLDEIFVARTKRKDPA